MNERLRNFIETLFEDAPKSKEVIELKEEMLQNLIEKYNDLINEGKSPEAAYNIATASVGDVNELIEQLKSKEVYTKEYENNQKVVQKSNMSMIFTTISIVLYILCPVPLFIFQNEYGLILLLVIVAIATGFNIYGRYLSPKYSKKDSTMVEEYKEWKSNNKEKNELKKSICGIIWSITLVIYFLVSFITGAWYITWLIFIIGGIVQSIVKTGLDLKK